MCDEYCEGCDELCDDCLCDCCVECDKLYNDCICNDDDDCCEECSQSHDDCLRCSECDCCDCQVIKTSLNEFDQENVADTFRPMNAFARARWLKAQGEL